MDIKLINGVGEIKIIDNDFSFYKKEELKAEIIQQIITMLNIRSGELKYNINFGLSHKVLWDTQADLLLIKEHIRNQILTFFNDYIKAILYVEMEQKGDYKNRYYEVVIDVVFFDDETIKMKGVIING